MSSGLHLVTAAFYGIGDLKAPFGDGMPAIWTKFKNVSNSFFFQNRTKFLKNSKIYSGCQWRPGFFLQNKHPDRHWCWGPGFFLKKNQRTVNRTWQPGIFLKSSLPPTGGHLQ
jgi:hypothetical protein